MSTYVMTGRGIQLYVSRIRIPAVGTDNLVRSDAGCVRFDFLFYDKYTNPLNPVNSLRKDVRSRPVSPLR